MKEQYENDIGRLNARLQTERFAREKELSERQAEEKANELKMAQEEVDRLLEAKRQLQQAQAAEGSKDDQAISKDVQAAAALLMKSQEQRKKMEEQLARQRQEEAEKTAAEDMKAKQEANRRIALLEREKGERLTEDQKKAIFEECARATATMESMLSEDQRRQQDETKKKLEEKRRKKEAEQQKKQLDEMLTELKRQEDDQARKQKEATVKLKIDAKPIEIAPEVVAEQEDMERRAARAVEDLRKKHEEEQRMLEGKLEEELRRQQEKELQRIRAEGKQKMLEMMASQTSRESMQMTEEQKAALMRQHEEESRQLKTKLDAEEASQKSRIQAQLEARRQKKKKELEDKQRTEAHAVAQQVEQQKTEFVRQAVMDQEKKVIDEVMAKQGAKVENAQDVAQLVMADRHRNEVQELGRKQQQRRAEEHSKNEAKLNTEREALLQRLSGETDRAKVAERVRELEAKAADDNQVALDALEMAFAEEQLQLKLQHWKEVSTACGMAAPEEALAKYQQKVAKRQVDDAEKELLEFKSSKAQEQETLAEKLRKEKDDFETKMQADYERRRKEQEEELARKEKQMQEDLKKEKERREAKLREARLAGVNSDKLGGPTPAESAAIQRRLREDAQADEQRLKEQLAREKERQDAELQALLRQRRERRAGRSTTGPGAAPVASPAGPTEGGGLAVPQEGIQRTLSQVAVASPAAAAPAGGTAATPRDIAAVQPAGGFVLTPAPAGAAPPSGDAFNQWLQALMQQLHHSPMMEKVVRIEKMLAGQVRHGMLSYYIDQKDRQIRSNEGRLITVEPSDLTTTQFVVYCFALSVKDNIVSSGVAPQLKPIKIGIAKSLEESGGNALAFRNSYQYDHSRRTLYIRDSRLSNIGEFVVVMLHGLAHVKAIITANPGNDRQITFQGWNDCDPGFLTEFYGMLEACTEEMFYMRLPASQAHRDTKDQRPYRTDQVMSAESLAAMEEQLRTIGRTNREGFLKTYLMM